MKKNISKQLNIALIIAAFFDSYNTTIWKTVNTAAKENDINLLTFAGGPLFPLNIKFYDPFRRTFIYDLINSNKLDGIICVTSGISYYYNTDELKKFFLPFQKIPLVSIGHEIENSCCIKIDNETGMTELVNHYINIHNYKKIAFIRGPKDNLDSEIRFNSYLKVLENNNIPKNNNLIVQGNFKLDCGKKELAELLDKRKIKFDSIICANDIIAVNVMNDLTKRGYRVPEDFAVAGFDDSEEGKKCNVPLTTVSQPTPQIGQKAVATIISMIRNKNYPKLILLPTKLVTRNSCGCYSYSHINKYIKIDTKITLEDFNKIRESKDKIFTEITSYINNYTKINLKPIDIETPCSSIIESVILYFSDKSENNYINKIIEILGNNILLNNLPWDIIFSIIFKSFRIFFSKKSDINELTNLWIKSLLTINENKEKINFIQKLHTEKQWFHLYIISQGLISIFKPKQLKDFIFAEFPKIEINSLYIFTFFKSSKYANLFFHFDINKNVKLTNLHNIYESKNVIYDFMEKNNVRKSYAVMALYYKRINIGFVLFEVGDTDCVIYESLAVQLSNAIRMIKYIKKIKNYSLELEKKVTQRTFKLFQAKNKIEQQNIKLKKLNSLKNDFITNITHDFRSPLSVILNMADLGLINLKPTDNENKYYYDLIYNAGLKLKKTIDRLLDLAKLDIKGLQVNIKKININNFLNKIVDFYSTSLIHCGIKIIKDYNENDIIYIYTDTDKLDEIINNIISNAIKFVNADNGIITVKIEQKIDTVLIIIIDNGIGIEKNKLKVIFERFRQVNNDSKYKGTGIGLAFSKQLIQYLKGKIWAESKGPDKGSSFFIELNKKNIFNNDKSIDNKDVEYNIIDNDSKKLIISEINNIQSNEEITVEFTDLNTDNTFDYKKGKILIIDDDKNIKEIIKRYLKKYEFRNFITTSNGKLGLDAVYDYKPDLIICDLKMPQMNGDELHDQLLKNPGFKKIPFIFLSAIIDNRIITERRKKGALAYLRKPVEEDELIISVEQNMKAFYEYLKIYKFTTKDELTGLYNKKEIKRLLLNEIMKRSIQDLSIIFINLDDFKYYNNKYGHPFGDQILNKTAETLKLSTRSYDIISRFEGDEFIIILANTNIFNANKIAEELRKKIMEIKLNFNSKIICFSASFGLSSLIDNEDYICKSIKINNLNEIYNTVKPNKNNWENNKNLKKRIADLLIIMAEKSVYKAKETKCMNCDFSSINSRDFLNNECPKCNSKDIIKGKNKIVLFNDVSD